MTGAILTLENLSVGFATDRGDFRAVDGIDLAVGRSDALGIVGESGSGKSQLLMAIMGLSAEEARITGTISLDGTDLATLKPAERRLRRSRRMAMVFQDPSAALNPYLTIGRQLTEVPMRLHGLSRAEAERQALQALDRVRMNDAKRRLGQYAHELSGGMRQRAIIAMALLAKPALLLADEPTTALDVTIQAEIIDIFADLARADGSGTGLILVTHDLGVVAHLCRRIAIMYAGRIVETGPVHAIFDAPRHPYTQALLAAMPRLDGDPDQPLTAIDGQPPGPGDIVAGCAFAPRCPNRMAACTQRVPMLTAVAAGHDVACLLVEAPVP